MSHLPRRLTARPKMSVLTLLAVFRRIESLRATKRHRPDLLASAELTDKEKRLLEEL